MQEDFQLFTQLKITEKRGLATVVTTALSLCLQSKNNYLPQLANTNDGNPNNKILTKLGFINIRLKIKTLSPKMSI